MIARLGSQPVIGWGRLLTADATRAATAAPTAGMPPIACIDKAPLGPWDA